MIVPTIRQAIRRIVRRPGVAGVSFLTLAAGIAVSATIFSVAWAVLVRPFPFHEQERLIVLWAHDPKSGIEKLELSTWEIEQLQKEGKTFEGLASFSAANFPVVVKRRDQPMHAHANIAGQGFFQTLGVAPARGRGFTAADHKAGAPFVVAVSHRFWMEQLGGDPKAVGQKLFNGTDPVEVVAVLPEHFDFPAGAELIFPDQPNPDATQNGNRTQAAVARMKPGATIDAVAREAAVIATHAHRDHDVRDEDVTIRAYTLVDELLGPTRGAVKIVFGMALLVLLIALFNIASIALAQGVGRHGEMGIRASVGASRSTAAMQLFVEFLVVSSAAAATGIALTWGMLRILPSIAPTTMPRIGEVHLGWETVAFAALTAIVAALIAAAAQSLAAKEADLLLALRTSAKATTGRSARRVLEALATAQIAVAIVTLIVAALLIESFRRYAAIPVGFTTENVVTMHLPRGYTMNDNPPKHHAFWNELLQRVRASDGVVGAGSVLMRPLEIEQGWDFTHTVDGQSFTEQERNPMANYLSCTPGYFEAMGIALIAGRTFTADDKADSQKVAIVSESFARRYWKTPEAAIGKRVKSGKIDAERPWWTVVGVVRDVRYRALTIEKLDIYGPFTQTIWSPNFLAVRTRGNPETVVPIVRSIVSQLDKEIPVANVRTSKELVNAKLAQPRLAAIVVALFAATASLLALIGLYGVLAYGVRQRTMELGVRLALGASERSLMKLVLQRALAVAAVGTLIGIVLSLVTGKLWRTFVYGVDALHPAVIVLLALGFAAAAMLASAIPAKRAMRVDPMTALRAE